MSITSLNYININIIIWLLFLKNIKIYILGITVTGFWGKSNTYEDFPSSWTSKADLCKLFSEAFIHRNKTSKHIPSVHIHSLQFDSNIGTDILRNLCFIHVIGLWGWCRTLGGPVMCYHDRAVFLLYFWICSECLLFDSIKYNIVPAISLAYTI